MSSLDIVTTEDEQFKEYYPKIMKKVEKKKLMEMEPTLEEITKVHEIINDFIKTNKRKVYGGYALNKLLIAGCPERAQRVEGPYQLMFYPLRKAKSHQ